MNLGEKGGLVKDPLREFGAVRGTGKLKGKGPSRVMIVVTFRIER